MHVHVTVCYKKKILFEKKFNNEMLVKKDKNNTQAIILLNIYYKCVVLNALSLMLILRKNKLSVSSRFIYL